MRLAAFQMVARAGDVAANLAMIAQAAVEARSKGADILVVPELAITGYGAGDAIRALAEPAEGAQISALSAIASREDIALVAGFAERAGESIYNSAALIEPGGRRSVYRKCHLYGGYEKALFAPGVDVPRVVELSGVKTGLLICYDVEFPEAARILAMAGAEVLLVPTALPEGEHAAFIAEKVVPVRAFENQIAIVYADHAGADASFAYAGRSAIVMPDGSDAARAAASGAAVLVADYSAESFARSRSANPYLEDRRADLF